MSAAAASCPGRATRSSPFERRDELARALDKARARHDRRPTRDTYTALLEAQVVMLRTEVALRDQVIAGERVKASEAVRRCARLHAARPAAVVAAMVAAAEEAERARRARRPAAKATAKLVPLLDHAGVGT